jgi:hypothetical protein
MERVVEHDGLASTQPVGTDAGRDADPQSSAGGEDIHRPVGVLAEEDPIAVRWLRQSIDLILQRGYLTARILEGGVKVLVAPRQPLKLGAHHVICGGHVGWIRCIERLVSLGGPGIANPAGTIVHMWFG